MLAPVFLFAVTSFFSLKTAVILLIFVPLIPVSIVCVQKIAKRLLSDYWVQYAKLGDSFLESLQGLTTLKIYQSDGHIHEKINEESERFRRITMKVLTMQLILMDIMMPNMNGWNAAQMIRSMKRSDSAAVPIIAISANSFADDIINSCISGINENLSKPIDDKALLNTIKKFIANRNSAL